MKPRKIVFRLNRADISGMLNRYISNIGIIPTVMMVQVLYKAWLNAVIARIKTTNRLLITLKLSNDALPSQSGLQCHSSVSFRFGYFLKSYLYFRKSNGSFSRKLPFLRELLISAAKIQIISEKLVQISENRATLTILSINQRTIFI